MDLDQTEALRNHVREIYACRDRILQAQDLLQKKQKDSDAQISEINKKNISADIRNKINIIYENAVRTVEALVYAESRVPGSRRRIATAVRLLRATDDGQVMFVEQAKALYGILQNTAASIQSNGFCGTTDEQIDAFAAAYQGIVNIHKNLEKLLNKYVGEDRRKKDACANILTEFARQKSFDAERRYKEFFTIRAEAYELNKLAKEINKDACKCMFDQNDRPEDKFSKNAAWHFGRYVENAIPEKIIDMKGVDIDIPVPPIYGAYDIPLNTDNGNVLITYRGESLSGDVYDTLKCAVIHFLMSYPAHFKNIAAAQGEGYYGKELIDVMTVVRQCCNAKEFQFYRENQTGVAQGEQVRDLLKAINSQIDNNRSLLGEKYESIIHFNQENSDNAKPITLLIMLDVNFDRSGSIERMKSILMNGSRSGVYVMFIAKEQYMSAESGRELSKFFKHKFSAAQSGILTNNGTEIDCCVGKNCVNDKYYNMINNSVSNYRQALDFFEFQEFVQEYDTSEPGKMTIPIGKCGSEQMSLVIDYDSQFSGAVIAGTTGTGKTALLHNIILSAAYRYDPAQLEIWLMDFKSGVSFKPYKKLKHVKALLLENKILSLINVLDYLINEMDRRYGIFQDKGIENIKQYNNKEKKKMPFLLAIIDEYTEVSGSYACIDRLTTLARKGRAAGISLILSSQTCDSDFNGVIEQLRHRFDFGHERGQLMNTDMDKFKSQLTSKGTFVYEGNTEAKAVRGAFVGGLEKAINAVNDMYSDYDDANPTVMSEPKIEFRKMNYQRKSVIGDDSVSVEIGKKELSNAPVRYKIDSDNPLLVLFGNGQRIKSIEYAIACDFCKLGNGNKNVYYLNRDRDGDDVITVYAASDPQGVYFAKTVKESRAALEMLYGICKERMQKNSDREDVGYPIEIILHDFVLLCSLIQNDAHKTRYINVPEADHTPRSDEEWPDILSMKNDDDRKRPDTEHVYDSAEYGKFLAYIFQNSKICKMYFVIHCEDVSKWDDCRMFLNTKINEKDAIIVPAVPKSIEDMSYNFIDECVTALGLDDNVRMYEKSGSDKSNMSAFNRCILVDEQEVSEYLPIEYITEA